MSGPHQSSTSSRPSGRTLPSSVGSLSSPTPGTCWRAPPTGSVSPMSTSRPCAISRRHSESFEDLQLWRGVEVFPYFTDRVQLTDSIITWDTHCTFQAAAVAILIYCDVILRFLLVHAYRLSPSLSILHAHTLHFASYFHSHKTPCWRLDGQHVGLGCRNRA